MPRSSGVKLIARDGHSHWADPTLRPLPNGFGLGADCDLGGVALIHWLAPDSHRAGHFLFTDTPYAWPSAVEAFAALDIYRGQE